MSTKTSSSIVFLGKFLKARSMLLNILIILLLAMTSSHMDDIVNCRLSEDRLIRCYLAEDNTSCSCCEPVFIRQSFIQDCNLRLTEVKLDVSRGPFTLNDVIMLTEGLVSIKISYTDRELRNIVPSTVSNVKPLKKIFIDGSTIDSISELSFVGLPNLEQFNLSNTIITTLPLNMFKDVPRLKHINLSNNKIVTIQPNTFYNMSVIQSIDLRHNKISCLTQNSFVGLDHLILLDLSYNRLENLTDAVFKELWRVEEIKLDFNLIEMLNMNSFATLNTLEKLSLKSNFIISIPLGIFYGLNKLSCLDLSHNELIVLSSENMMPILDNFKNANSSIQLDGNQIDCCHLHWASDLLYETKSVRVKNSLYNLTCNRVSPRAFTIYSFTVSETDLENYCLSKAVNSLCPNCDDDDDDDEDNANGTKITSPVLLRHYRRLTECSELIEFILNYSYKLKNATVSLKNPISISTSRANHVSFATLMLFLPLVILSLLYCFINRE